MTTVIAMLDLKTNELHSRQPYPLPDLLEALCAGAAATGHGYAPTLNRQQNQPAFQRSHRRGATRADRSPNRAGREIATSKALRNITGQNSLADSTLNSVVTTLQQVVGLGTEGANGTLSATDRAAIVNELTRSETAHAALANTSYQGQYLFAGTAAWRLTQTNGSSSSGVTYKGNTDVNQVTIGNGYSVQIDLPWIADFQRHRGPCVFNP